MRPLQKAVSGLAEGHEVLPAKLSAGGLSGEVEDACGRRIFVLMVIGFVLVLGRSSGQDPRVSLRAGRRLLRI